MCKIPLDPPFSKGEECSKFIFVPKSDRLLGYCLLAAGEMKSEAALVNIYRSVGPNNTTALASGGAANTLSISGTTATFASALPNHVGVGDAMQYDSDDNGSIDSIAFIYACTSATVFTVKNSAGNSPASTSVDLDWSLFRAYTSLSNAESGDENSSLNAAIINFDAWSGGKDLTTSGEVWNIACYGDAADTTPVVFNGWITASSAYLKIYTPFLPSEVGQSQRHDGKWNTNAYRMELDNNTCLILEADHFLVEGLQFTLSSISSSNKYEVWIHNPGTADISVSHNIFRGLTTNKNRHFGITVNTAGDGVARIWNNLLYNFEQQAIAVVEGINIDDTDFTAYIYNNTVYNCFRGISLTNGTVIAKNNLTQSCLDGFYGTFDGTSEYNLSDLAGDAPGTNPKQSAVSFVDAGNFDFHLAPSDTGARNSGVDLSGDTNLAVWDDIDSHIRAGIWDIGADEEVTSYTPTSTPTPTDTPVIATPTPTDTPVIATPTHRPTLRS